MTVCHDVSGPENVPWPLYDRLPNAQSLAIFFDRKLPGEKMSLILSTFCLLVRMRRVSVTDHMHFIDQRSFDNH